jgi:uncharacterized repeat protein (TIGR01451 family)
MATLAVGQDTLLRLLNAGLQSYAPTVQGTHMKMIAEDGNRYQYRQAGLDSPRDQYQYSTLLASLKTTDAVITPASLNGIVIYDRRLHLVNNLAQDGGMFVKLDAVCLAGSCADLSIAKTDGVTSVNRGAPLTYNITVGNAGPTAVTGAQVADILPADFTGATWTCSATVGAVCGAAAGSGNIATTVDLPVGGTATFMVSGTVSVTATGNLVNTASVTSPAGVSDPNPTNNSSTDSDAVMLLADLSISKTDGVTDVVAGGPVSYTIVAGNAGPDPATGVTVTDTLPATLSGVSWTCTAAGGATCAASGSGNLATAVDLPVGGTATFTVSGTLSAAATGSLVNTASVAAPANVIDANAANDSAIDTDTITPLPVTTQAYFSTAGNTVVPGVAGANDDADIYAWNSDGSYARVFDASVAGVPAAADVDAFVYNGAGDVYLSFNNDTPVNLPGAGLVEDEDIVHWNGTTWSLHFDGSAVGLGDGGSAEDVDAFAILGGSVLVSTFGTPAVPGLTGLTDKDLLQCAGTSCSVYFDGSDIALTTLVEDIDFAGVAASGDLRLSTRGTFAVASGASSLTGTGNQVFACTGPTTGATSACAGFASVLTLPTLPTGVMDAISAVSAAAPPAASADLAISKTDGVADVTAGSAVSYTIVASNAGPDPATGASVTDTLPATLSGVSWTCAAAGGASCAASGSGNLATPVNLPMGGTATFTVSGTLSAAATGSLVNTASVAAPAGVGDPNAANNSATDTDTITPVTPVGTADLAISKTDGVAAVTAGGAVTYTIVASNAGPDLATGATVTDTLPASLSGVSWTCVAAGGASCAASGSGNLATPVDLPVGGTTTFMVSGTLSAAATGTLVNTASVAAPAGVSDPNAANNSATDSDTITPSGGTTPLAYFSTVANTAVPGVTGADDADIYAWNSDGSYARVFGASAAGVPAAADVDAFVFNGPGDVYLSFNNDLPVDLPGAGLVEDEDIVHWNGTTWSLHFDGSAVGLGDGGNAEDVDAFAILGGSVLVSTFGSPAVPGLTGLTNKDLLQCAGTSCSVYFDGSDIALATIAEDIDFASVAAGGDIRLSVRGAFAVASGASSLTGSGDQVFACTSPTTGADTACAGFASVLTLPTLPTGAMDAIGVTQ